jgi:hypothetical protein
MKVSNAPGPVFMLYHHTLLLKEDSLHRKHALLVCLNAGYLHTEYRIRQWE